MENTTLHVHRSSADLNTAEATLAAGKRQCPGFIALLAVSGFLIASPAWSNGFLNLMVASGYEENLPRGYLDRDIHGSGFVSAGLSAGKLFQPRINTSLVVSASGARRLHASERGFDYGSVGLGFSMQHKLGMGPYTPRVQLSFEAAREDSRGAQRDRDLYSAELSLARRFTPALNLSLGIATERSRGRHEPAVDFSQLPYREGVTRPTDPMDFNNHARFAALDYTLRNGWQLTAGYRRQDGYVVSSAAPPVVDLFIHTRAVALDPAFDHLQLMYLMESTADLWTTSLSIPLSRDSAVDIGYHWQDFAVDKVGSYDNAQFLITLVHRF